MTEHERTTRIAAPLETVWSFHLRPQNLLAVTPRWLNLQVNDVDHPGMNHDQARLREGSIITLSARPFDVGTRREISVRVTSCRKDDHGATLVDELVEGPIPRWRHVHRFVADDSETILTDRIRVDPPDTAFDDVIGPMTRAGLGLALAYRHFRTRKLLG
ncbi:MAG: SRPBCC family protein [Halobacteriaceae archaeon]